MDSTGLLVLTVALALAAGFGLHRFLTDGRLRPAAAAPEPGSSLRLPGLAADAGPAVVQFSSEFCTPCRATSALLTRLQQERAFAHIELDVAEHLELARELNVTRTPTVLVLDGRHRVRFTTAGAPTRTAIVDALDSVAAHG